MEFERQVLISTRRSRDVFAVFDSAPSMSVCFVPTEVVEGCNTDSQARALLLREESVMSDDIPISFN